MQYINEIRNKVEVAYDQARGTELEKKVKAATSPENWAATNTQKQELARATHSYDGYREIMPLVWERLQSSTKKNWQVTFKALDLLETFIKCGSDRVLEECRERLFQIRSLQDFHCQDEKGNERGSGIRACAKRIVDLLNDHAELDRVRKDAAKNRDKFVSMGSSGSAYGSGGSDWGGSSYGGGSYDEPPRRTSVTEETSMPDEPDVEIPKKKKKSKDKDGTKSEDKGEKKKKKKKEDEDEDPFDKPAEASGDDDDDDAAKKKKKDKKKKKKTKDADSDNDSNKGDEEDGDKTEKKKKKKIVVKMRDPTSSKPAAPPRLASPDIAVGEPISSAGDDDFGSFASSTPAHAKPSSDVSDLFSQIGLDSNRPAAKPTTTTTTTSSTSFDGFDDFNPRGGASTSTNSFDDFSNFTSTSSSSQAASNAFFTSSTSSQPQSRQSFDIFGAAPTTTSSQQQPSLDIFASVGTSSNKNNGGDEFGGFASATPTSQARPTTTSTTTKPTTSPTPKDAWDINGLVNLGNITATPAQQQAHRPAINAGKPSMSQLKGDTFSGLGFTSNAPLQQPGQGFPAQAQRPPYQQQQGFPQQGFPQQGFGGMGGGFGQPQAGFGGGYGQPQSANNAFAGLGSFPAPAAKPKSQADINNVFF